jgi:short subunit fatty acids transporter
VVHRVLPDPLIFAILLTVVAFTLALGLTPSAPSDLVMRCGSGFWNVLAFSMLMVQFPFYAGIQALVNHSGLAGVIKKCFVDIANVHTFSPLALLISALINFAVPSGGCRWVVQGLFVMPAAQALGADLGKSAMAIAFGEAWEKHNAAVLGAACAGYRRFGCSRHHGLLRHSAAVMGSSFRRRRVSIPGNPGACLARGRPPCNQYTCMQ